MTIKKKLIISFLIISIVSLNVTTLLGYYSAKNTLRKQLKEKVVAVADTREQHLLDFLDRNKKTIATFSTDGMIMEKMKNLMNGSETREEIQQALNEQINHKIVLWPDIYELFIMDLSGIVVASTNRSSIGNNESYDDYFLEGRKGLYIKDAHYYKRTGKNSMVFSHPIYHQIGPEHASGEPPHLVGVVTVRLETSVLNKIVSSTAHREALTMSQGLGKDNETYLVNKNGLMLTPSRFLENVFLRQKVDTLPVKECQSENKETIDIYKNYMGKEVVGASMCIPSMNWVLLMEIDTKEAFAPIVIMKKRIIYISLAMIILIILSTLLIVRKIFIPIKILTDVAQQIGDGNLNHVINIKSKDEIGILAQKFNEMTANLEQRSVELTKSEKRFRDLFESSRDAIMTLDPPDWKFTSGNLSTIKMFGARDEKEFISYEPWKLSPEKQPDGRDSSEKAKEMIVTAMREGFNFFEWTHKRIDGEEFPATVLLSRIEQDGNVFLQATVRDITKSKETENELKRFNKLAIDRELKMIELKQKIKTLENKKNA